MNREPISRVTGTVLKSAIVWIWPAEMGSTHYNSNGHDDMYDTNFTADISNRMQVPKRIRVGGIQSNIDALFFIWFSDDFSIVGNNSDGDHSVNGNYGPRYDYKTSAKYEMNVPDRILVVGNLQKFVIQKDFSKKIIIYHF